MKPGRIVSQIIRIDWRSRNLRSYLWMIVSRCRPCLDTLRTVNWNFYVFVLSILTVSLYVRRKRIVGVWCCRKCWSRSLRLRCKYHSYASWLVEKNPTSSPRIYWMMMTCSLLLLAGAALHMQVPNIFFEKRYRKMEKHLVAIIIVLAADKIPV